MLLLLSACAKPVDAPEDLDELFHYFWSKYEDGTDEELLAAAANLDPLIQEASEGLVTDLTDEEQATVDLGSPRDPAEATGMFVAGPLDCAFSDTERLLYALDQDGLYEGVPGTQSYDAYNRVYTSDLAAYQARDTPFLTWTTTYTVTPLFTTYTAVISGSMRYVAGADGAGPVVIQRSFLADPAVMEGDTEDYFDQDYQLDLVLPNGSISAHAYTFWRDLQSAGLDDESTGVQNLLIDGLVDFYDAAETVCATGGF